MWDVPRAGADSRLVSQSLLCIHSESSRAGSISTSGRSVSAQQPTAAGRRGTAISLGQDGAEGSPRDLGGTPSFSPPHPPRKPS